MGIVFAVYQLAMLALATAGILILLFASYRATKRGIRTLNLTGAVVGCISLGAGLVDWANYLDVQPLIYTAFASFILGYGGHAVAFWNLDPVAAKRLLG